MIYVDEPHARWFAHIWIDSAAHDSGLFDSWYLIYVIWNESLSLKDYSGGRTFGVKPIVVLVPFGGHRGVSSLLSNLCVTLVMEVLRRIHIEDRFNSLVILIASKSTPV